MTTLDADFASIERISHSILIVRRQRVLLDSELADLYGVATARLNQQVRRNLVRFPADFMFQLTTEEHGAIMAATLLNSPRAVQMSIYVDSVIVGILKTVRELMNLPEKESRPIGFVPLEDTSK